MLYEFAMTPDLFDASVLNTDSRSGIVLVQLLRGIAENGLLANLHKDRWVRHVVDERIATLSPELRAKILKCISMLHDRHRLVRHPKCLTSDPLTDPEWLDLAFESHDRIPFHAIILSKILKEECNRECDALVEFLNSLDSAQWIDSRKRTLSVTKSKTGYQTALAPILRHAKSLVLIDPYLNSQESRYFDTITICSNALGQRGHTRLQGRIDIHAKACEQKPSHLTINDQFSTWAKRLLPLISADGHRFRVFLWESMPNSEKFHDRYILTDQCGITVSGGLDCRSDSHPNSTDWSLMDDDVRLRRWDQYDPAANPIFKIVAKQDFS